MISLTLCKGSAATVAAELSFTFIKMAIAVKMTAPVTEPMMIVKVTFEESAFEAFDGLLAVEFKHELDVRVKPTSQLEHTLSVRQVLHLVILQATHPPYVTVKFVWQAEQIFVVLQYSQLLVEHSTHEVFATSEKLELQEKQTLLAEQVLHEEILQVKH